MTLRNMFQGIPLTPKMLLLTFIIGVIAWGTLDLLQTKNLKAIFDAQLTQRLEKQAHEDRIRFDNYVSAYHQAAKLIVSQNSFTSHLRNISRSDDTGIKYYKEVPPWLPDASVLRKFIHVHYALLLDKKEKVREVYQGWPEPPPQSLLQPDALLRQLSHNQSFMTDIDGRPFIITAESVKNITLMLASPLHEDFLIASQGYSNTHNIVALLTGDRPEILASNRPDLLPSGTLLDNVRHRYLVFGKSFFDYGASDLTIQFASFISKEEFEKLGRSILVTERKQRAITALVLILSFGFLMFYIIRHIKKLSLEISDFSQNILGVKPVELQKGDELRMLETQFNHFKEEIIAARETIRKEAEEKIILIQKAFEAEQKEKELKLLGELKEKTIYLDSILHSSTIAIAATDLDFRIKYYNPMAEKMFGYTAEEVIGQTVPQIHLKRKVDPARFERAIEAVRREGEYRYIVEGLKEGGKYIYESRVYGIGDRNSNLVGFVLMSVDITERRLTERRLATQYAVTRILAESATLSEATPQLLQSVCENVGWDLGEMWRLDPAVDLLRWDGIWHMPELNASEFEEASKGTVFSIGTGLPGRVWASSQPAWIKDVVTDANFPRAAIADRTGLHSAFAFPVMSSGEITGVMAFFSRYIRQPDNDLLQMFYALGSQIGDFMRRKKAEEDLKHYSIELERSNRELEQFASIASHDLQEPLRVVAGFAQLLEKRYIDKLNPEATEFISYMVDGVNRMQRLIKDLLEYSKITTRSKPFRNIDCDSVVESALLNLKFSLEESGAVITHDKLPEIMADEGQLVQLFQNLIGNGIKYHGKVPPRIHISAERTEKTTVPLPKNGAKNGWLFSVQDNGIGIDPQYSERIFKIFQRLHSRDEYPGTGIGLAICNKIVERHGGHIWVDSKIGQGSVFYFIIPDKN